MKTADMTALNQNLDNLTDAARIAENVDDVVDGEGF
jgi:hypothetical protein